ncbi:MAG: cytidine deaminase [Bacilli bacterium]|jgi:cytidine deaminase
MTDKNLVLEAKKAMANSYSPYSNFPVGAALVTKDGQVFHGANIENAAYGLSMCGERNAIFNAYNHGIKKDDIVAIAVIGNTEMPISPCGSCRQVMSELLTPDCKVILANTKGDTKVLENRDLLPYAFTDSDL